MIHQPRKNHALLQTAAYLSEQGLRLGLAAVTGVIIARYIGPAGLGMLSFAVAVFGILAPMALLGMREVLVREFATREDWPALLVSAVSRQLPVALLASVVGFGAISLTRGFGRTATLVALAVAPLPLLALRDNLRAYLESANRTRTIVIAGSAAASLSAAIKIAAVALGAPLWFLAATWTIEAALLAAGLLIGMPGWREWRKARVRYRPELARRLVRESWPLLISVIAITLYMRADIVMLGALAGDKATGVYAAAAQLSEAWYILPVAAMAAARPRLARLFARGEHAAYRMSTQRFLTVSGWVALVAAAAMLLVAPRLVQALYGPAFAETAGILRIHILAAPFVFLGVGASQWFIDRGMTKAVMLRTVAGATINILLNMVLIPSHGPSGAAIATLISYALANVLLNAIQAKTRPVFRLQASAFLMRWH